MDDMIFAFLVLLIHNSAHCVGSAAAISLRALIAAHACMKAIAPMHRYNWYNVKQYSKTSKSFFETVSKPNYSKSSIVFLIVSKLKTFETISKTIKNNRIFLK